MLGSQLQFEMKRTTDPSAAAAEVHVTELGRAWRESSTGNDVAATQSARLRASVRSGTVPMYVARPLPKRFVVTAANCPR